MTETKDTTRPDFAALLEQAISNPGLIHQAYSAFHGYSLGNRILAWSQCAERQIPIGPIASFNRWKELGRHVVKGQKAISLCMPITMKRETETTSGETETAVFQRFVFRRNWFVLAQTEGAELPPAPPQTWDKDRALTALEITETAFDVMDGNCQGYAVDRRVAVSPVAALPYKTLFHEMAHVLLGHTKESLMSDSERTPRDIREIEAESVAMLVCAALEMPGIEYSRGYIQTWNRSGHPIPDASARKILKTADQILSAGRPPADKTEN